MDAATPLAEEELFQQAQAMREELRGPIPPEIAECSTELEGTHILYELIRDRAIAQQMEGRALMLPPAVLSGTPGQELIFALDRVKHFVYPGGTKTTHSCASAEGKRECDLRCFAAGETFAYIANGRRFIASGDVFVCAESGLIHVCTDVACDQARPVPRAEKNICRVTGRLYSPDTVCVDEEATKRFRENRDGCVARQSFLGKSAPGLWRPKRTHDQRMEGRLRAKARQGQMEEAQYAARASSDSSWLIYVADDSSSDSDSDGEGSGAAKRRRRERISLLEKTMCKFYPGHSIKQPPEESHGEARRVCRFWLSECVEAVRSVVLEKIRVAEAAFANTQVPVYLRKCQAAGKAPDELVMAHMLVTSTNLHWQRLCEMGAEATPPSKEFIAYLSEISYAVWFLMCYTPHGRRYGRPIPFVANVVGILFTLREGLYLKDSEGQPFFVIDPHPSLTCLPQKADLNHSRFFRERGITSSTVCETAKLIENCFNSLANDRDTLELFRVAAYIRSTE
jgi:hypothetical protein